MTNKAPLRPLNPPNTIFEVWHIDHVQLSRLNGFNYVLVLVDSLSLFSIFYQPKRPELQKQRVCCMIHFLWSMVLELYCPTEAVVFAVNW